MLGVCGPCDLVSDVQIGGSYSLHKVSRYAEYLNYLLIWNRNSLLPMPLHKLPGDLLQGYTTRLFKRL
jgi:hypothetical protein